MAEQPTKQDNTPRGKLERQGIERLAACRVWKSLWDLDIRECYFFASPQRQRQIQSYSPPPMQRLLDAAELNTDIAFELCGDFATEVIQTFMPQEQQWCERGRGPYVSEQQFDQIVDRVRAADKQIFLAIKSSNFYPELSKAFDPDLAIGTVGMWIDPPRPGEQIVCSTVPLRELEVNLGPYGEIDDRFAVRHTRNCYVRELVGEDIWKEIPEEKRKDIEDKPAVRTEVRWGFWRKWDRHDDEVWQHVVYVGNDLVHETDLVGAGSCPLVVFRWNPNPDWPWGHGPLMQYLPTLRQVDELELMRSEHAELAIRPPYAYPDDSFAAIEQGLEPGMGYPIRVGSQDAIKAIVQPPPPDAANYQYEEKEHRLRKGFFVDFPQQSGDTPPTLGQWLDELARAQRRIGRPGLAFWSEGPAKIFVRFKYLVEKAGAVEPIKIDGKTVALLPYNPTQRAAEQQEIATAVQALNLGAQTFPEEFKMVVDGKATMLSLFEKMRVIGLIKMRDQNQIAGMVDMMSKLAGAQQGGGAQVPGQAGAPGPAAT